MEEALEVPEGISVEDGALAIEIFLKALTFRPQIQQKTFGQDFVGVSIQQIIPEMLEPRVMVLYMGPAGKFPCLFFRFVGTESPVVEAIFYPYQAILFFLSQARSYIQWANPPDRSEQERESMAQEKAIEMTLIMLDSFHQRSELMMDSFISEVLAHWRVHQTEKIIHFKAEKGDAIPGGTNPEVANAIRNYSRELAEFWRYQIRAYSGGQKVRFVTEYDEVYKHWKRLSKMLSEEGWREYAKAGKFADTPDDLIDRLENLDRSDQSAVALKVSDLALEHAGRRARLINKKGVSQSVIRQRKAGIRATGYTRPQLYTFLKEGRQIIERVKQAPEMKHPHIIAADSGQEKMENLPDQTHASGLMNSKE